MAIKLGKPKHHSKTTQKDILDHPIWVNTYAETGRYNEEHIRPVVSKTNNVSSEILRTYFAALVTFRIDETVLYGQGIIAEHDKNRLHSLVVLENRKWRSLRAIKGLKPPMTLIVLPKILGKGNLLFTWNDIKHDVATRAES